MNNATHEQIMQAAAAYEAREVAYLFCAKTFLFRMARMEAKLKQHGITPEQYLSFKSTNYANSHT